MKSKVKNILKTYLPLIFYLKIVELYFKVFRSCPPIKYDSFDFFVKKYEKTSPIGQYKPRSSLPAPFYNNYCYEPELLYLIDTLLPDDGFFFDIGTNYGAFTAYVGTKPKFSGQVFSFEPVSQTFCTLKRLVENLKIENKVKLFNVGLSDKSHKAVISCESPYFERASFTQNPATPSFSEEAKLITLDSLNVERCDFLKIDVEGYELKVIKGGLNTIQKYKPFIFMETTLQKSQLGNHLMRRLYTL